MMSLVQGFAQRRARASYLEELEVTQDPAVPCLQNVQLLIQGKVGLHNYLQARGELLKGGHNLSIV